MKRRTASVTGETAGGMTTLDRLKLELGITVNTWDALLRAKIEEATSDIEWRIRPLRFATVVDEFWPEHRRYHYGQICWPDLQVSRYPVRAVSSIVVDGAALSAGDFRIVQEDGLIYKLDSSGLPCDWTVTTLATVTYTGGYIFPEDTDSDLPAVLESAVLGLVTMFWMARGRDPTVRVEENPGVYRFEYWVGAVGKESDLPPSVMGKLEAFLLPPAMA